MGKLVQKIGLGTVQFGMHYGISNTAGQTTQAEVAKILEVARRNTLKIIDTASAYGNAEHVLGQHDLSSFRVVSKFMPPQGDQKVSDQLEKSLKNLGLTALYGYLAHRPDNLSGNLFLWEELQSLKQEGFIQKIGFSLNEPTELEGLLKKNIQPDIIQAPFNYFDRRFKDLMIFLKKEGCEIHSRSAFLQGLFFMDIDTLDRYFNELIPLIKDLQKNVENLPGSLLNFVLKQPFIDTVVIGVENREQFIQNLDSMTTFNPLPDLKKDIPESIILPSNWPA